MNDPARTAINIADAKMLHDRVTAAFGESYLIGPEIGRGGMAVVYSAEDVRLQRQVALKVLPPDLAFKSDVRERFVREAQTAARLNHPHIVSIYAVHEEAGMVCFAMALVLGETLAERLQREPRPTPEFIASVLEQTADALAYAHACGIVHRDIKPDNILLDRNSGRALVTDFGIARAAEGGSRLTQTGIAVGTPAFMSPEQATGDKDVDGRSDLYSLGVVGYLMLAGRLPFEATSTPAMLVKHVSETPPPIRSIRSDVPSALADILERCLAKRPADRWESAMALRDALRRVQRDGSLQLQGGAVRTVYTQPGPGLPSLYNNASSSPPRSAPRSTPPGAVAREYAGKAGHRAEDWSPLNVGHEHVAPALPPMPDFPPLSSNADKAEQREWRQARKEAMRDWRIAMKDQRRDLRDRYAEGATWSAEDFDNRLIGRFKHQVVTNGGVIVFLVVINALTSPEFPWAIFPAMGMSLGILSRYSKMRSRGITWNRIWQNERDTDAVPKPVDDVAAASKPQRIASAAAGFRKHLKWFGVSAAAAVTSFVIGASLHLNPMLVPFVGSLVAGFASSQLLIVDYMRLRRLGVSPGDALSSRWKSIAASSDDRTPAQKLDSELHRLAGPAVLASAHGNVVRNAVEDFLTIQDAGARLTDADKMLVPDVEPTANALLERITALAAGLERLDRDIPADIVAQLDVRIASVEAEPENASDKDRRLQLLTRQRSSLHDLVERRETMARQLESASLTLRSLRFDMVKLRTLGVGAAISDVTSATQEARAISLDIGRVLDAADEVRKLT